MSIDEFAQALQRRIVALVGAAPDEAATKCFGDRGYALVPYSDSELSDPVGLTQTDSVIFIQRADKPLNTYHALKAHAKRLLNHGCRIYVCVADDAKLGEKARSMVVNALASLELPGAGLLQTEQRSFASEAGDRVRVEYMPAVCVCDAAMTLNDVANLITRNPAGKSPNFDLGITVRDKAGVLTTLSDDRQLLLKRAFHDCARIQLSEMVDGLSGAPVYRAHAELTEGLLGPWPFLYFVKIGPRRKIEAEFARYLGEALSYIPFHLGPRLSLSRCCLGGEEGVLVGDFVKGAEPLRDAASGGRAGVAIAHLFNETLGAWRNAAQEVQASIPSLLLPRLRPKIPSHREGRIRSMDAKLTLDEVMARFGKILPGTVLVGPVHGDLHATNVLIRGTDAIVIDFESLDTRLPLLFDLACLEGGLLVEGFRHDKRVSNPARFAEWFKSVRPLYDCDSKELLDVRSRCHPSDGSAWFHECVRQIRMQAAYVERGHDQYAAALAFCLINKACNPALFKEEVFEILRASAYVLGEYVLKRITNSGA